MAKADATPRRGRVILDASAIIAISRGSQTARATLEAALIRRERILTVPGAVAETVRGDGPRDAPVNRVLAKIDRVTTVTEAVARQAGALLGETRSDGTIDALLVSEAILGGGGVILTSDVRDIALLIGAREDVAILRV